MIETSLHDGTLERLLGRLRASQSALLARFPGERDGRQPVHTLCGGAHLFTAAAPRKLGDVALRALDQYAPDPETLVEVIGVGGEIAPAVYSRVVDKLEREPVEDLRIDFEDGYGNRPHAEEDGHAIAAAAEVARGMARGSLPPFIGIRIKNLSAELGARALRTLDLFVTRLVRESGGALPARFFVTLPKVIEPEQVAVAADALEELEGRLGLSPGALELDLMIESTRSLLGEHGQARLPELRAAARGRAAAAHFGTYDYTASCSVAAAHQHTRHPSCDFARHALQVAFGGTGLWLADGVTNILPIPPHRAGRDGRLSEAQQRDNRRVVHGAWRRHAEDIRHSLECGFYQGWDLHPGQLVSRYATTYAFFLAGLPAAAERLRNFIAMAAQATMVGAVFDDAATGQGLLNFFLRGMSSGALTGAEVAASGLSLDELRSRSFLDIVTNRCLSST